MAWAGVGSPSIYPSKRKLQVPPKRKLDPLPKSMRGCGSQTLFPERTDPGPAARLVSPRTPAVSARRRGSPVPSRPPPGRPRWLRAGEEQRPAPPPRPPAKAGPWRVRSERGREPEPSRAGAARGRPGAGTGDPGEPHRRSAGACRRLLGSAGPPGVQKARAAASGDCGLQFHSGQWASSRAATAAHLWTGWTDWGATLGS